MKFLQQYVNHNIPPKSIFLKLIGYVVSNMYLESHNLEPLRFKFQGDLAKLNFFYTRYNKAMIWALLCII